MLSCTVMIIRDSNGNVIKELAEPNTKASIEPKYEKIKQKDRVQEEIVPGDTLSDAVLKQLDKNLIEQINEMNIH